MTMTPQITKPIKRGNDRTMKTAYAQEQQVPQPKTAAEVPGPAAGTAMTKEYVQMVGRMAYVWGWPMVNMGNRSTAFSKLPEPGLIGGILPAAFNGVTMLTDYVNPDQRAGARPQQEGPAWVAAPPRGT